MAKRIGLIQTHGIGDIIIALPIADHFEELGYEVVWPIDERFVRFFQPAKPSIKFLPVALPQSHDYFFYEPVRMLAEHGCERTVILYSWLFGINVIDTRRAHVLKFDEYKYAIAGVPFSKKWDLKYERNMEREQALYDSLNIEGDYLLFHGQGGDTPPLKFPPHMSEGMRVIEMDKLSDDESPLDWGLTLERATKLILLDSCFANLVEQLNLSNPKSVITDNNMKFTPVFKNGWDYLFPDAFESTE